MRILFGTHVVNILGKKIILVRISHEAVGKFCVGFFFRLKVVQIESFSWKKWCNWKKVYRKEI